jgi:hypothetical protein
MGRKQRRQEGFMLFSNHNKGILRRQPGAAACERDVSAMWRAMHILKLALLETSAVYLFEKGLRYVTSQPEHQDAAIVQQVGCVVPHNHGGKRYTLWSPYPAPSKQWH